MNNIIFFASSGAKKHDSSGPQKCPMLQSFHCNDQSENMTESPPQGGAARCYMESYLLVAVASNRLLVQVETFLSAQKSSYSKTTVCQPLPVGTT